MSYATPAQVKAMFRNITANASNQAITDAVLQEWLDEAEGVINSRLKYYYALPITSGSNPQSAVILRKIERLMVACQVDDTLNSYTDKQKKPQYCKQSMEMLDMYAPKPDPKTCKLCEPASRLPDATYLGVQNPDRKFSAQVTDTAPTFKKGVDAW